MYFWIVMHYELTKFTITLHTIPFFIAIFNCKQSPLKKNENAFKKIFFISGNHLVPSRETSDFDNM